MEIFKDVIGYEGIYKVSNYGNVFSVRRNKLLSQTKGNGYLRVGFNVNGLEKKFLVHRLVAEHFILNPESKEQVNHIDGDKTNNKAENLEWVSQEENIEHAYKVLNRTKVGERAVYIETNGIVIEFESLTLASQHFEVNLQTMYSFLVGRNKTSRTMKLKGIDGASFNKENIIKTI